MFWRVIEKVTEYKRKRMCVCVCVCEREREREREMVINLQWTIIGPFFGLYSLPTLLWKARMGVA